MTKPNNPIDVYKILPKTNCRQCGLSTCLAFAAAVVKLEKRLDDCPHLSKEILAKFEGKFEAPVSLELIQVEALKQLQKETTRMDLSSRAERLGAAFQNGKLALKCLGKDFEIDQAGALASHCHTHAGFAVPLLNYVVLGSGTDITGRWVTFRDLKNGPKWNRLFEQRCEKPLKQIADIHPELFEDLITIFSGQSSTNQFSSDIAVVLYPFPKVPVAICYWKPEDDLESRLHIFFDSTAEENLNIESLYTVGVGLVTMLEKIMAKHGG